MRQLATMKWGVAAWLGLASASALLSAVDVGAASVPGALAGNADGAAVVTFTGLRVYPDGSATLVVNLTRKTPVEASQDGNKATFLLAGAKVRWRNNKNPLLAEYFKSNVLRAKLDDTKDGVKLVIRLRENVRLQHEMTDVGEGALLRIDIPAPSPK